MLECSRVLDGVHTYTCVPPLRCCATAARAAAAKDRVGLPAADPCSLACVVVEREDFSLLHPLASQWPREIERAIEAERPLAIGIAQRRARIYLRSHTRKEALRGGRRMRRERRGGVGGWHARRPDTRVVEQRCV